ncbi:MAG: indole-3-glycerol-phosphate synthase [bacterium]
MDEIVEEKKRDLFASRKFFKEPKMLKSRFKDIFKNNGISLIAELKPASPVKGKFVNQDEIFDILKRILNAPISALSVLTDKHFNATTENISVVKAMTSLPVLRKDFIIDEVQIYESNFYEVDALLLIARILDRDKLQRLYELTIKLGIEPIIEVYSVRELDSVLKLEPSIVLINNRNLETFECDISHTEDIIKYIPYNILVISASGINTRNDVLRLETLGVKGILVGEAIMSSSDPRNKIMELMGIEA